MREGKNKTKLSCPTEPWIEEWDKLYSSTRPNPRVTQRQAEKQHQATWGCRLRGPVHSMPVSAYFIYLLIWYDALQWWGGGERSHLSGMEPTTSRCWAAPRKRSLRATQTVQLLSRANQMLMREWKRTGGLPCGQIHSISIIQTPASYDFSCEMIRALDLWLGAWLPEPTVSGLEGKRHVDGIQREKSDSSSQLPQYRTVWIWR